MLPHQDLVINKHLVRGSQKITVTPGTELGQLLCIPLLVTTLRKARDLYSSKQTSPGGDPTTDQPS